MDPAAASAASGQRNLLPLQDRLRLTQRTESVDSPHSPQMILTVIGGPPRRDGFGDAHVLAQREAAMPYKPNANRPAARSPSSQDPADASASERSAPSRPLDFAGSNSTAATTTKTPATVKTTPRAAVPIIPSRSTTVRTLPCRSCIFSCFSNFFCTP